MKHCLSQSCRSYCSRLRHYSEQGVALLLVLWIITLLGVICAEFSWTMRTELTTAQNYRESEQAYYAAEAGINRAVIELMRTTVRPKQQEGVISEPIVSEDFPYWEPGSPRRFEFSGGSCEVLIEDEANKIEINTLLAKAEKDPASLKALLKKTFKLEGEELDIVADSLIDWHDKDDNITGVNGAESDYYRQLHPPYVCRNGDIPVIEELLLVRGIDEALLFGPSRPEVYQQKTRLTREELQDLLAGSHQTQQHNREQFEEGENVVPGFVDVFFATNPELLSLARINQSTSFKIDVNTATFQQLLVLDGMTPAIARQIIAEREERRFSSTADPRLAGMAMYEVWKNQITASTGKTEGLYKIIATGHSPDGRVSRSLVCTAVIRRNGFFMTSWKSLN